MLLLVCKFSGYFRKRKLVTELLVKMLPMSWCAEGKHSTRAQKASFWASSQFSSVCFVTASGCGCDLGVQGRQIPLAECLLPDPSSTQELWVLGPGFCVVGRARTESLLPSNRGFLSSSMSLLSTEDQIRGNPSNLFQGIQG